MGQAKQRGTFEERQASAIIRNREAMVERVRELAEREASLTPQQRRKRRQALHLLTTAQAFTDNPLKSILGK